MFIQRGEIYTKVNDDTYEVKCPAFDSTNNIICSALNFETYSEGKIVAVAEFSAREWLILGEISITASKTEQVIDSLNALKSEVDVLKSTIRVLYSELATRNSVLEQLQTQVAKLLNKGGSV